MVMAFFIRLLLALSVRLLLAHLSRPYSGPFRPTRTAWIFKGHVVKDALFSGESLIVDKTSGEIRFSNVGYPEDRMVENRAVIVEPDRIQKMLNEKKEP